MSPFTVLAVVAAVLAVLLVSAPTRRLPGSGTGRPDASTGRARPAGRLLGGGRATLVVPAAAAGVALLLADGTRLALALVGLGVAAAAGVLVRRGRAARAADARRAAVVDVCEALAGELRAGQPLVAALEHCVELWPDLEPVAGAARLDADVPDALRRLARRPGAEGLQEIASAWQVSRRSGAGLATTLGQVAVTARARQGTQALVKGELASAQATARLVALLPLASLGMSAGIGGDPWHFLLATPVGVTCLALGAAAAFLGLLWIDRIATAVTRG